jgi:hypothetical protein
MLHTHPGVRLHKHNDNSQQGSHHHHHLLYNSAEYFNFKKSKFSEPGSVAAG